MNENVENQDEQKKPFSSSEFQNAESVVGRIKDGVKLYVYIPNEGIKLIAKAHGTVVLSSPIVLIETDKRNENGMPMIYRIRCNRIVSNVEVLNVYYADDETFTEDEKKSDLDSGSGAEATGNEGENEDDLPEGLTSPDATEITLALPIKKITKDSETYMLVITDANDVEHYFDNDLSYDGMARPSSEVDV